MQRTNWHLLKEEYQARKNGPFWVPEILGTVVGTREEALDQLESIVRGYVPNPEAGVVGIRIFRTTEGFTLVSQYHGLFRRSLWGRRFYIAELLWDSNSPAEPPPMPPFPPSAVAEPEDARPDWA